MELLPKHFVCALQIKTDIWVYALIGKLVQEWTSTSTGAKWDRCPSPSSATPTTFSDVTTVRNVVCFIFLFLFYFLYFLNLEICI